MRWNIREDIAGASFMAFGSAAPEIIVNAVSTIKARGSPGPARLRAWCLCCGPNGHLLGQHMASMERAAHTRLPPQAVSGGANGGGDPEAASLGVGAIIGSGIIAFSLIPGCCGLCVCPARDPVWRWLDPSCAARAALSPARDLDANLTSPRRAAPCMALVRFAGTTLYLKRRLVNTPLLPRATDGGKDDAAHHLSGDFDTVETTLPSRNRPLGADSGLSKSAVFCGTWIPVSQ